MLIAQISVRPHVLCVEVNTAFLLHVTTMTSIHVGIMSFACSWLACTLSRRYKQVKAQPHLPRRLSTAKLEAREQRPEETPNGAHMDIGAHGDLSTLHWVQSAPCPHPDFLSCEVTYGAAAVASEKTCALLVWHRRMLRLHRLCHDAVDLIGTTWSTAAQVHAMSGDVRLPKPSWGCNVYVDKSLMSWLRAPSRLGRCGLCSTESPRLAGAINFKDVMIAYGKLPKDAMATGFSEGKLGFEFSGLAPAPAGAPARRVMGIAKQAIATRVDAPPYLVRAPGNSSQFCCLQPLILMMLITSSELCTNIHVMHVLHAKLWNRLMALCSTFAAPVCAVQNQTCCMHLHVHPLGICVTPRCGTCRPRGACATRRRCRWRT